MAMAGPDLAREPDDGWTPSIDQPWRPVHPDQIIYLFDYGQPWCQDRHGHPQYQPSGYPSITHHPTECQSYGGWFDGWFEDARGCERPARSAVRVPGPAISVRSAALAAG